MAISARQPSTLDTNKFMPEEWSKNIIMAVKSKLVAVPAFNYNYGAGWVKGDTFYLPKSNAITATEVTVGTEGTDSNPFNTSAITLTINNWFEARAPLDEMSLTQSQVELQTAAEEETAYALRKKIDSTVCDLFSTLNGSSVAGTDGSAWTDPVLIAAVEKLDENDVSDDDRVWIADPSTKADIMAIDKFVRLDYGYGDPVPTGTFRKDIYGAPLLITNNLTAATTGSYGVYAHKKAIAVRISQDLKTTPVPEPLKHRTVILTTALWGVAEVMDTFGYPIYTRLA